MAQHALCIGINDYPGTQLDLAGCVNDAQDWAAELASRGYAVTRLLNEQATKAAMVEAFRRVIGAAAAGDTVVITYSGHGTYVPDQNGDEEDGLDEALCPHDIQTGGGALIDDEIHALFAARRAGVKLVLISDSCHSGTVTRDVGVADAEAEALPRPRFLPMGNWSRAAAAPAPAPKPRKGASPFKKAAGEGDLLLAGCREGPNHYSYDTRFRGRPNGAFTYHALKALHDLALKQPDLTYAEWHAAITPARLPTADCPQEPQIFGSEAARNTRVFA